MAEDEGAATQEALIDRESTYNWDQNRHIWEPQNILRWWRWSLEEDWCRSTAESKGPDDLWAPRTAHDDRLKAELEANGFSWWMKCGHDEDGNPRFWDPFHLPLFNPFTDERTPKHPQYGGSKGWVEKVYACFTEALWVRVRSGTSPDNRAQCQGVVIPPHTDLSLPADANAEDSDDNPFLYVDFSRALIAHQFLMRCRRFGSNGEWHSGADFQAASFGIGADFRYADLSGAVFNRTDLPDAKFVEACLIDADFRQANLNGAQFNRADLRRADLWSAVLSGANLRRARLSRADLSRADLSEAELQRVDLERAVLNRAKFKRANLRRASLRYANLSNADLSEANLSCGDLRNADLTDAHLTNSQWRDANVAEVRYTRTKLRSKCYGVGGSADMYGDAAFRRDVMDQEYIDTNRRRLDIDRPSDKLPWLTENLFLRLLITAAGAVTDLLSGVMKPGAIALGALAGLLAVIIASPSPMRVLDAPEDVRTLFDSPLMIGAAMGSFGGLFLAGWWGRWLSLKVWDLMDNGRSWLRVLILALVAIIGFGWAYEASEGALIAFPLPEETGLATISDPRTHPLYPWYVAAIGFCTLGIADLIAPQNGAGQLLIIGNVAAGFATLGLLLAVLADRFARRA